VLANPAWDRLSDFRLWLETQPADATYPYSNSNDCACARFLKSRGEFNPDWMHSTRELSNLNLLARGARPGSMRNGLVWKFGDLLDRVNAKLAELETV
jgi:hypothetical protein